MVAVQAIGGAAFAQGGGEADASQAKAPPTARTTPKERVTARTTRNAEGRAAARGPQLTEGEVKPTAGATTTRAERRAAALDRYEASCAANRQGQLSRGGNSDAPECQRR
ncbi:MAG: hypothetical protein KKC79_09155 [Gammaproteobacteria bacterium]|nr:hypothetical protein [Gammaproteobacteria bacterium]MBU1442170.1 hypothetical protein [Gammaproteobacteria bacterium]MBU2408802.1 hypothetical protein [Gammaproteobacteria bacterium]